MDLSVMNDEFLIDVLRYLQKHPNKAIRISDWQHNCNLGYARACKIRDLLISVGIVSERKYKMPIGKDGKRHREYLPYHLLVSSEELDRLIKQSEG